MSSSVTSARSGPARTLRADNPRYGEKAIFGFLFFTAAVSVLVTPRLFSLSFIHFLVCSARFPLLSSSPRPNGHLGF